jgi:hypothetical protein
MKKQTPETMLMATIIGLTLVLWVWAFLAIYGAVRLAERFGLC